MKINFPRSFLYTLLILISSVYIMPIYMTIITAFKSPENINLKTSWVMQFPLNVGGFWESTLLMLPYFKNSLILTITATFLSVILGAINGYIFSKRRFPGSEIIFVLILFGMFIPYQIILIPLFQVLNALHLYGGLTGLILAHVIYGIPLVTLIFRNFYDQIPDSLLESAEVDGANYFNVFVKIILPLSIPGFVVAGIWQFTQIWNEFLWAVTLTDKAHNPITVGLSQLAGGQAVSWNVPMAGSLLASAPAIVIFIVLGKYFISGLLSGSVKE